MKFKCVCGVEHTVNKKTGVAGRSDKHVAVEDHGVGFMFVGTNDDEQVKRLLAEYVDDPEAYVFVGRTWYDNAHATFVSTTPGATWYDGS